MRDTAANGGKSEGLQIMFTRNGTRPDGTHHRADTTVTVDDVGGKLTFVAARTRRQIN